MRFDICSFGPWVTADTTGLAFISGVRPLPGRS
jgi:hypothetical protein